MKIYIVIQDISQRTFGYWPFTLRLASLIVPFRSALAKVGARADQFDLSYTSLIRSINRKKPSEQLVVKCTSSPFHALQPNSTLKLAALSRQWHCNAMTSTFPTLHCNAFYISLLQDPFLHWQTNRHATDGQGDSMTELAQWADSVKIHILIPEISQRTFGHWPFILRLASWIVPFRSALARVGARADQFHLSCTSLIWSINRKKPSEHLRWNALQVHFMLCSPIQLWSWRLCPDNDVAMPWRVHFQHCTVMPSTFPYYETPSYIAVWCYIQTWSLAHLLFFVKISILSQKSDSHTSKRT